MDASLMRQSALLIPAYQPDDRLPPYVEALKSAGVGKIIVVDDGSGDKFQPLFGSIPQDEVTHVISYTPNGGKGHAMREGMRYLLDHCPEQRFIITADSDGQHTVRDVLRMIESLSENHEGLLLGSRDFSQENVPFKSATAIASHLRYSSCFTAFGSATPRRVCGALSVRCCP